MQVAQQSSLQFAFNVDTIHTQRYPKVDQIAKTKTMVFPSIKKKLDLSDTPSRKSKVQFHGEVNAASGSPDSNDSFDLSDATTVKEMVARIETLNLRLAGAKLDLSGEKALRSKKEKNLVKLAKELNKRSTEAKSKNEEINNVRSRLCVSVFSIARKLPASHTPFIVYLFPMALFDHTHIYMFTLVGKKNCRL